MNEAKEFVMHSEVTHVKTATTCSCSFKNDGTNTSVSISFQYKATGCCKRQVNYTNYTQIPLLWLINLCFDVGKCEMAEVLLKVSDIPLDS